MSDANARQPRRRWLAIAGAVSGVLIVSLGVFSFWPGGAAQDGPNDTSDAGDESASAPLGSAAFGSTADARDAGSNVFFVGNFSDVIGANRDEQTILVVRDGSWKRRAQHAYFVVHLDGRTEDELVLPSEGYDRETEDPSALNTPESRAILGRLEGLARRFRRMGVWLPFLAFPDAESWNVRFDEDGGAEIDANKTDWSWVRRAGSPEFVRRPRDSKTPRSAPAGLPVISYDYDDRRTAHLSEGIGDVCFFWEAPPAARRKLTCFDGISAPSVFCDHGVCGLFVHGAAALFFSLVDQRSARKLGNGFLDGIALDARLGLAVNHAGRVAISHSHSNGGATVVDVRTGIVRERRGHSSGPTTTVWIDDDTLIACDHDRRDRRRLVRLSLDDEGVWEVRKPDRWWQADVDGGSR
ncbi:hypothetical protein [Polyangium sp. 15x6]|uniref:hypothetical protein n=1 Tax=Polyangium sp. 15x6 TaxID=3042687 RepID=UPI002499CA4D|nr:hypothetical protein [Polyangium sp. 15x6]MDI3282899.1 hypothetical protein [Polyangium sp. 15x6]